MTLSQDGRLAKISGAAVGELALFRMSGSESLGRLFEYDIELVSENGSVSLSSLLGTTVTVTLNPSAEDGKERYFNGLITRATYNGNNGTLTHYHITVHPKIWLLTRASNCRIFANQSVPDIVKKVFTEHGYTTVDSQLETSYVAREYCVQYRETDFNFISRLLEEEGIYYFFKHDNSSHTLVLCDNINAHQPISGTSTISFSASGDAAERDSEEFSDWSVHQEIQTGAYLLDDFDFTGPSADLSATANIAGSHDEADKKFYDYPGYYVRHSEDASKSSQVQNDGQRYVKIRMQEQRAEYELIQAAGNIKAIATGYTFTLSDFPQADQNRAYLVVSTNFYIQNSSYLSGDQQVDQDFHSSYSVLPTTYTYRPARLTPHPVISGVQTAIVVGQSGDEITTDKYGRVKVQFHWDQLGKNDQDSSCWIRVAQLWAGKNWGGVFTPRIGQEVIVDFIEGNPDRPIIIGSVYNNEQMPPYTLPDNKTQSGIKSQSTTNGSPDNFNEIRFEDKIDSEEIYVHAEKDFNRVVENNDTLKVGFDKQSPGDQTVDIYNNRTITLDQGNDQLTVKTGNSQIDINQGNVTLNIEQGNRTTTISQGNDAITVSMGNRTIKVSTGQISEEAMQGIELKVGSSSVKIDQMGVTIKGMNISIEGQLQTEVKGLMTTVSADTMLTAKGAVVMIN